MNGTPKGWVEDNLLEELFTEMGIVKGKEKKRCKPLLPLGLRDKILPGSGKDPLHLSDLSCGLREKNAAMTILGRAGRERVE